MEVKVRVRVLAYCPVCKAAMTEQLGLFLCVNRACENIDLYELKVTVKNASLTELTES